MDFIESIIENGGTVFVVGGYIRDKLYSHYHDVDCVSKDIDLLVTGMDMEILINILEILGDVKIVGILFGVIIYTDSTGSYDIALPRKEISTGNGYQDFKIVIDKNIPVGVDLERRDATINAIAVKIDSISDILNYLIDINNIIDPFNGIGDIKDKIWKAVGNPLKRFLEDPTRILRAIRQCSQYGLQLEGSTQEAILIHSSLIKKIIDTSPVRLTEEILRCLKYDDNLEWMNFVTNVSDIGKHLDLIGNADFRFLPNMDITTRIAMVLYYYLDSVNHVINWTDKFKLTAAVHFPSERLSFIIKTKMYLDSLDNVSDKISMKRIVQNMGSMDDTYILIQMYECIKGDLCIELYELLDGIDNIIFSTNEIRLNGHIINREFGLVKRDIGELKEWLFEQITLERVMNDMNKLIPYIKKKYIWLVKNYKLYIIKEI